MGLMSWLRGGGRTAENTGAGTGAGTGPGPGAPRERVDLAELPPIQRMVGPQDLVIDPAGFQGALSTRQDSSLGTPLGHLVSPDAPTGLVHGITEPAAPAAPAPVQRAVPGAVELPGRGGRLPLAVSVQRVVPGGPPAMTWAGASAEAERPVRQLVGERPLAAMAVPELEAPHQGTDPSPGGEVPVQRAVVPGAGVPRRAAGLGAPMSGLPPTAQRRPATDVPGGADGSVPTVPGTADGDGGEAPGTPRSAQAPGVPEPEPEPAYGSGADVPTAPLLGDAPLLPSGAPDPGEPAPAPVGPAPAVQRTPFAPPPPLAPPPAPEPVAPLLAARPLELRNAPDAGASAVQRSVTGGVEPSPLSGEAREAGVAAAASPPSYALDAGDAVPVRWTSPGPGAAPLPAGTPAGPAALQRTGAAPRPSPPGAPPPRPPLAGLQRQAAGGPPVPRSVTGSAGPGVPSGGDGTGVRSFTTAGAVALAAGVAQRAADGSVVFGPPPPAYASPVIQRETVSEEPPPPDPPEETAAEPEPGPEAEPAAAPGAHTVPGGPAAGAGPGGAPVVTDELVRALYPPLSRLFKADLRLERERAGFLINTRH
ncbi:hypothetical protein ACFVWY_26545 [Streptomyces sp. NPDC058195]|uniref:hypothetical protein n=1 Tax=Streptomyces sp. NPDC058195 TaxID=3346375 RepID=UPI0036EFA1FC